VDRVASLHCVCAHHAGDHFAGCYPIAAAAGEANVLNCAAWVEGPFLSSLSLVFFVWGGGGGGVVGLTVAGTLSTQSSLRSQILVQILARIPNKTRTFLLGVVE
jgi:hypothetical protein